MIAVIDYGVGNLFSLTASLKYLGADVKVTGEKEEIEAADRIILPGVGAFADAKEKLDQTGLVETILEQTADGQTASGDLPGYAAVCLTKVMNTACTRVWDSSRGRSHLLMKI